jgi:hypothetical protein
MGDLESAAVVRKPVDAQSIEQVERHLGASIRSCFADPGYVEGQWPLFSHPPKTW